MKTQEQGAVLILTLVVLVMLTFYGVVSTRDAKTQYQIAGNMQAFSKALAVDEGVLTKVENSFDCAREFVLGDPASSISPADAPVNWGSGNVHVNLTSLTALSNAGCSGGSGQLTDTDVTNNQIMIDFNTNEWNISPCQDTTIDYDGDGDPDGFILRAEKYVITVINNHIRGGRRKLRSTYVATSRQYCGGTDEA